MWFSEDVLGRVETRGKGERLWGMSPWMDAWMLGGGRPWNVFVGMLGFGWRREPQRWLTWVLSVWVTLLDL